MAKKDELKETANAPEVESPKVEAKTETKTEGNETTEKAPEVKSEEKAPEVKSEEKAPEVQEKLDARTLKTSALVSGVLYVAGTFAHQIKAEHLELIDSKHFE